MEDPLVAYDFSLILLQRKMNNIEVHPGDSTIYSTYHSCTNRRLFMTCLYLYPHKTMSTYIIHVNASSRAIQLCGLEQDIQNQISLQHQKKRKFSSLKEIHECVLSPYLLRSLYQIASSRILQCGTLHLLQCNAKAMGRAYLRKGILQDNVKETT